MEAARKRASRQGAGLFTAIFKFEIPVAIDRIGTGETIQTGVIRVRIRVVQDGAKLRTVNVDIEVIRSN